jgi:hypothetical protein
VTGSGGYYSFPSLPAGAYTVRAEKTGYRFAPETRVVSLPAAGAANFVGSILTPVIPPTTKVISTAAKQSLESVSADGADFTFAQDSPQLQALAPGDVMVSEPAPAAPYGFLRRVAGKYIKNGKVVVQTEPAALEDAITEGSFSYNEPFKSATGSVQVLETLPGVTITPADPEATSPDALVVNFANVVLKGKDSDPFGLEVVANGTAQFTMTPHFSVDLRGGEVARVRVTFDSETYSSLKVGDRGSRSTPFAQGSSVRAARFVLGVVTFFLGPVPVVVVPEVTVDVGLDGKMSVGAEWGIQSDRKRTTVGAEWEPGNLPRSVFTETRDPVAPAAPRFFFEAEVKGYVEIGPVLKLYGVAGPFARLRLYARGVATLDVAPNPGMSISVYLGVRSRLGSRWSS